MSFDYFTKIFTIRYHGQEEFVVMIVRGNPFKEALLAYIEDSVASTLIGRLCLIADFTDVLGEDYCLPLLREVEFTIELLSGTPPIYCA